MMSEWEKRELTRGSFFLEVWGVYLAHLTLTVQVANVSPWGEHSSIQRMLQNPLTRESTESLWSLVRLGLCKGLLPRTPPELLVPRKGQSHSSYSPPGLVQAPRRLTTLRWWPMWMRILSSDMRARCSLCVAPSTNSEQRQTLIGVAIAEGWWTRLAVRFSLPAEHSYS